MRPVGILGGMGPEATVLLMQKVIAAVSAEDDADHIPLLVDQNPQVPSRIKRLIDGTGADPAPVLVGMAQKLQAAGAEALAMPCNTAHHYAGAVQAATSVPFLDMVALSVAKARDLAGADGRVGILASPAVRQVGLFDAALAKAGLTPVYASDETALLTAIRSIKAAGPTETARATLHAASHTLLNSKACVQLIACTEFSLIADVLAEGAKRVDTLDVLVEAIVAFSHSTEDEH
ncbi:aspartate/glutamate racemase family protein [Rhodophyticola sp. CCM32]|uniref:aspartate/glutamate racemase family protein n=1 Tax=Rhodophyticola sp. CCM32 TaxID=2916397 RepID=UPI00107F11C2|nr:amino acid racemase [Rhodophyticola sp. CCM32]QBY01396.1 aspartate/glutamate racemase family protein [Rhodophyticola sp. CCM32]